MIVGEKKMVITQLSDATGGVRQLTRARRKNIGGEH